MASFGLQAAPKERRCSITEDQLLELVHQHKVSVYQYILYLLGNREDVKDITQSTARQKIGESFMQCLFKCQFYLMMLLAAMLLMVGAALSDDHTDVSTQEIQQTTQKPTIMILGSTHLANDGLDVYNTKMDDVLAPKRQREIEQMVTQLKPFRPTKIAVELDPSRDAEVTANYQAYLEGTYELGRYESDQIGFRLAKQMGHSKVYGVDYWPWPDRNPFFPDGFDWDLINYRKFAETHNQEHFLRPPPLPEGKITKDKNGATWIEPEKYVSIIDMYIRLNEPEGRSADHQAYLQSARVGLGDQYPGANWVSHSWYDRNLKIYVNLTRITESTDDRILLIIGAGHVYLVQQFLEESGDYIIESPLKYLDADAVEKPISEETD